MLRLTLEQDMKMKRLINHPSRLHDLRFLSLTNERECMLAAAEDRKVSVYAFDGDASESSDPPYAVFMGHTNR
jgi:protein MAK11